MTVADTTRYLLPPKAYHRAEWLEAEHEQLFERTWMFVGVEHDLSEPGDYISTQVGRAPVVVVRGEDDELRAFHNMCRHRGLPLVDDEGNCGKGFVCPYHSWNYRSTGELRVVPQRDQYVDFDTADKGLLPIRCDVWKSLVFVHLGADPSPIEQWMAGLTPLLERFRPDELVEVSDQRHEVAANWKLYVENHVDWLHLWYLHRETLGGYDHSVGERHELDYHWASFEPEADLEFDPAWPLLPIPGLEPRDQRNGAHYVFPGLTLFTNSTYWMIGQLSPLDSTRFSLRLRVFAVEGSDGAAFEEVVNRVMFEDYAAATKIQRVVTSPAYAVGPLTSSYEREIMRFHEHYLEHVAPPA